MKPLKIYFSIVFQLTLGWPWLRNRNTWGWTGPWDRCPSQTSWEPISSPGRVSVEWDMRLVQREEVWSERSELTLLWDLVLIKIFIYQWQRSHDDFASRLPLRTGRSTRRRRCESVMETDTLSTLLTFCVTHSSWHSDSTQSQSLFTLSGNRAITLVSAIRKRNVRTFFRKTSHCLT